MMIEPETYYLPPTPYVPNSPLPALVYRQVLGETPSESSTQTQIEANHWLKGGVWKAYTAHHFHSVTHECYAVFCGSSTLLLGSGPLEGKGVEVDVKRGDIIVLPAGVSHCSVRHEGGYEYVGLYPEGSPHWDNNFCKASPEETEEKADQARKVPIPEFDPIYGRNGPLVKLWRSTVSI